jgi:hypothetical protein
LSSGVLDEPGDFDALTVLDESTSLLTTSDLVGRRKTRAMAHCMGQYTGPMHPQINEPPPGIGGMALEPDGSHRGDLPPDMAPFPSLFRIDLVLGSMAVND